MARAYAHLICVIVHRATNTESYLGRLSCIYMVAGQENPLHIELDSPTARISWPWNTWKKKAQSEESKREPHHREDMLIKKYIYKRYA